ncbi:alpha-glucosidase [Agromyces sp. PvR057]|uniref:alpha-glucosidase n=1 Tax=Agromyces sp. PvR057 TaxID=3156403 RepID=UPI0033972F63
MAAVNDPVHLDDAPPARATRHPGLGADDPWWKAAVVYQVYPRSFADSNGDGIGDIPGIIDHLGHLEDLGVDVVWLSPVYASPQDDNGYDISDYYAVDPSFGTLEDLHDLIAGLHARGMKLVMDLVVNHTSDEHDWFRQSASSRDDPKRDWYIWRDPRDGAEPNNWGSFFSGPAWTLDEATGQYYLHLFSKKQPDLNWENPDVRAAIHRMMNWWLDRGVDGFRMDVISFISKHPDLPDGPVPSEGAFGDGIELFGSGPRIHEFLQEMHREVFAGRDADLVTVGEMVDATPAKARLYTDPDRRELDMVFHFEHVGLDHGQGGRFSPRGYELVELKRSFAGWQRELADVGWNSLYWNNHDQPRVVSRFGNDAEHWYTSATALATVLHLQRGTPYVYQGEELGMRNMPFTALEELRDIESLNHARVSALAGDGTLDPQVLADIVRSGRDNARTPMQWTGGRNAGFTEGEPWIRVNPDHASINAEAQRADAASVFAWYRRLIELRHTEAVVIDGVFDLVAPDDPQLFAYTRTGERTALLVIANCSDDPAAVPADVRESWSGAETVLANMPGERMLPPTMAPWQTLVVRRSF